MNDTNSKLLDGTSGPEELREFLEMVPNFRRSVIHSRETVATVIRMLYEAANCHHKFPDGFDDKLDANDHQFKDFLHTVLLVAGTKIDRIEAVYGPLEL